MIYSHTDFSDASFTAVKKQS